MPKIDSSKFTDTEWSELYLAGGYVPQARRDIRISKLRLRLSIRCCATKITRILDNGLGPEEEPGGDRKWIGELARALLKLAKYL